MKPSKLEEQIREILMLNYYGDGVVDADRLHGVVSDLMALFSQTLSFLQKEVEEEIYCGDINNPWKKPEGSFSEGFEEAKRQILEHLAQKREEER